MNSEQSFPEDAGLPPGPPPWLAPAIQGQIAWRDGDIVVSVPPKSGTTWSMNIVHQLRTGGDANFEDIYAEVPWIEFLGSPTTTVEDVVAQVDAMPNTRRRAFKTHAGPPDLPFHAAGSGLDVRYLVVARNPDEAIASFRPFLASHSDEWFDAWQVPKDPIIGPDFPTFVEGFGLHAGAPMIFSTIAAWWPLRHEPNVHLVHYRDLVAEPEQSIRAIADFLGITVQPEQWPAILEHSSFAWMKAREDRFEARTVTKPHLLVPGAMLRKGKAGDAKSDGVTAELSRKIAEVGHMILPDAAAFDWLYSGGAL